MFFLVPAEVGNLNVPVLRPVPILEIGSVWQELQELTHPIASVSCMWRRTAPSAI